MTASDTEWDLIILEEIDSINTQTIWHAVSLARSQGIQEKDLLIIDWPKYPIVSCGFHQSLNHVVDLEYCKTNNIPVIRRVCGGGAVLLDSDQLFYHIIAHIDSKIVPRNISSFFAKILEPVVQTYRHFNIDAKYRPVNDIIVENRKISGNGAGLIEQAQVLTGNFILDFPRRDMSKILRVPNEKFRDKVYKSLEAGITSFKDEIGYIPDRKAIIKEFIGQCEELLGVGFTTTSLNGHKFKSRDIPEAICILKRGVLYRSSLMPKVVGNEVKLPDYSKIQLQSRQYRKDALLAFYRRLIDDVIPVRMANYDFDAYYSNSDLE